MAIIREDLEAVRYLFHRSLAGESKASRSIIGVVTYKRSGKGFTGLLEEPYVRTPASPRALNIIASRLAGVCGGNWYYLVQYEEGLEMLLEALLSGVRRDVSLSDLRERGLIDTDKGMLSFLRNYESTVAVTK